MRKKVSIFKIIIIYIITLLCFYNCAPISPYMKTGRTLDKNDTDFTLAMSATVSKPDSSSSSTSYPVFINN